MSKPTLPIEGYYGDPTGNVNIECERCEEGVCERESAGPNDYGSPTYDAVNGSDVVFEIIDGRQVWFWLCAECADEAAAKAVVDSDDSRAADEAELDRA